MNYFEILNVPVAYNIDISLLTKNYFALQREGELRVDVGLLNEAYNVLKNDIKRAEHFLSLKNISVERISTELAMKMFAMREKYDSLSNDTERMEFQKQIKREMKELVTELKEREGNLEEFSETFGELKFLSSFLERERSDVYCRD